MLWMNRQDEVVELLGVQPEDRVLEVGYGPGGLIRCLARSPAGQVCGVDPSPVMRAQAMRHTTGSDLRLGTAEATGFGDAEFDCVVSVNSVGLWPNLERGLDELHRVARPGGRVVIGMVVGGRPGSPGISCCPRGGWNASSTRCVAVSPGSCGGSCPS